jgi:dipeptidyl aminopeptidase/acylaminoacyl peptidase
MRYFILACAVICSLSSVFFSANTLAAAIPASELFRSSDTSYAMLNPNADLILMYRRNVDKIELVIVETEGLKEHVIYELKPSGKLYISDYDWVDSDTVVIKLEKNGDSVYAFIDLEKRDNVIEADIRKVSMDGFLLSTLETKNNNVLFAKIVDGKGSQKQLAVYEIDKDDLLIKSFKRAKPFKNTLNNAIAYSVDHHDDIRFAITMTDSRLYTWYLDLESNQWRQIFEIKARDYKFKAVGILDNGNIAVLSNKDTDLVSLVEFDPTTKTFGKVLYGHTKYDLIGATLSADNKSIKSVRYVDHGQLVRHHFSEEEQARSQFLKKKLKQRQFIVISQRKGSTKKVIYAFAANDPGHFYLYDEQHQQLALLAKRYNDIETKNLRPADVFTVKTEDNVDIEVIFTQPKKSNGVLLVIPHGGPIGVRDYATYSPENQYFASRGYSILNVNFRGSGGFGKSFQKNGTGEFGKRIEQDITAAVNHIKSKYTFKNTCAVGTSYGGYSSLMLSIYHPDEYDCIVAMYGVYDLPLLFNASNYKSQEEYTKSITNVVGEYGRDLEKYSPVYLYKHIQKPVLLIAGKEDEVAGFEQSYRMKYMLEKSGANVEHVFYNGVEHGHHAWTGEWHEHAYVDDFIRRTLGLDFAKSDRDVVVSELMDIADSFAFEERVDKDGARALEYYRRAAALNNARAMHNVGSYYHRGEVVDENMTTALDWYNKALDNKYADSGYRMGVLYEEGKFVEINLDSSLNYFQKASDLEHEKAQIKLGLMRCDSEHQFYSKASCAEVLPKMSLRNEKTKAYAKLFRVIVDNADIVNKHKQAVASFLQSIYGYTSYEAIEFETVESGHYDKQSSKVNKQSAIYEIDTDNLIGAVVEIKEDNDRTHIVKRRWTHPTITEPVSQKKNSTTETLIKIQSNTKTKMRFHFLNDYEIVPGEWKLELLSLDDKVLYTQTYQLVED